MSRAGVFLGGKQLKNLNMQSCSYAGVCWSIMLLTITSTLQRHTNCSKTFHVYMLKMFLKNSILDQIRLDLFFIYLHWRIGKKNLYIYIKKSLSFRIVIIFNIFILSEFSSWSKMFFSFNIRILKFIFLRLYSLFSNLFFSYETFFSDKLWLFLIRLRTFFHVAWILSSNF